MSKWYKGKRIFKGKRKQQIDITAGSAQQSRIGQSSIHSTIPHVKRPSVTGTLPKIFTSRKKDRKGKRRKRSELKSVQRNIQKLEERKEKQQLKTARDTETDRVARILIQGDYAGDPLLDTVLAEYDKPAMSWQEADAKTGKINSHVVETREEYRRLAHMAMKYKSIDELEKAIKSSKGITRTTLQHIHEIALTHPSLYNEGDTTDVSRETSDTPTEENTADSRHLIYDSIMSIIEDALGVAPSTVVADRHGKARRSWFGSFIEYLAYYLKETLDKEIQTYGDMTYKAIELCGSSLVEDCRGYIYDSKEDLETKKARLESILYMIRGYYTDESLEQSAIWSDALDEFEDY